MKAKKSVKIMGLALMVFMAACQVQPNGVPQDSNSAKAEVNEASAVPQSIMDGKGIGEVKEVKLTDPLVEEMIAGGKSIYEMKCSACHKLDSKRVVGPGWEGITNRRKPEWIMNMTVSVEAMLEQDPEAQKLLELCMVRMPNQGLSVEEARNILEFMRKNDVESTGQKDKEVSI